MKIVIDPAKCAGHARCAAVAPQLFELDENGYVGFSEKDVPPELEALARRAARACPERVISLVDDGQA